jgi:L-cysteine desulfidase
VSIVQAIGRASTSGTGYASGFVCDGAPHTFAMQIIAAPTQGGLHFKTGQAAIFAEAGVSGYDANFVFGGDSASTGWIGLRIR